MKGKTRFHRYVELKEGKVQCSSVGTSMTSQCPHVDSSSSMDAMEIRTIFPMKLLVKLHVRLSPPRPRCTILKTHYDARNHTLTLPTGHRYVGPKRISPAVESVLAFKMASEYAAGNHPHQIALLASNYAVTVSRRSVALLTTGEPLQVFFRR
ncbi:hypothetical protein OSTOST_17190 [Ostertagia ostertagi]